MATYSDTNGNIWDTAEEALDEFLLDLPNMSKYIVTIALGDEAMQGPEDIIYALRDVISRLEYCLVIPTSPVYDRDGNLVGSAGVTE